MELREGGSRGNKGVGEMVAIYRVDGKSEAELRKLKLLLLRGDEE